MGLSVIMRKIIVDTLLLSVTFYAVPQNAAK